MLSSGRMQFGSGAFPTFTQLVYKKTKFLTIIHIGNMYIGRTSSSNSLWAQYGQAGQPVLAPTPHPIRFRLEIFTTSYSEAGAAPDMNSSITN